VWPASGVRYVVVQDPVSWLPDLVRVDTKMAQERTKPLSQSLPSAPGATPKEACCVISEHTISTQPRLSAFCKVTSAHRVCTTAQP
jgi:hypothetical protein